MGSLLIATKKKKAKALEPPLKDAERKARLWRDFLGRLERVEHQFIWYLDPHGQIRCFREDLVGCFCPLTAILFAETGERVVTCEVHTVAIPLMAELDMIATDIVEACDDRPNGEYGRKIRKMVGLRI